MTRFKRDVAIRSLVRVRQAKRKWGMGVVIPGGLIVTASHCLPRLPEPMLGGDDLVPVRIASFMRSGQKATGFVVFADPCADIAVIGTPPDDGPVEEFERFLALHDPAPVRFREFAPPVKMRLRVCSHRGRWHQGQCEFLRGGRATIYLRLIPSKDRIGGGTSGSPGFDDEGSVIAILSSAALNQPEGFMSRLDAALPLWLLRELGQG